MKFTPIIVALLCSSADASLLDKISKWISPPHDLPTIDMSQIDTTPLATITDKVFFDIDIMGEHVGQIVLGLYGDVVPKTVENFVTISKGTQSRASPNEG